MLQSQDAPGGLSAARRRSLPAVGRRLRIVLIVLTVLAAVLGANSAYLAGITFWEWATGQSVQNFFYQYMFLAHLALGLLLIAPLLAFVAVHLRNTWGRRNRQAVRMGLALMVASLGLVASGVLLMRLGPLELKQPALRSTVYWVHVLLPIAAVWLYVLHRLAGAPIRWRLGAAYGFALVLLVGLAVGLHRLEPRSKVAPAGEAEGRFRPSLARTAHGGYIPAGVLMDDRYCRDCHADVHAQWSDSVHRFSSFNNPVYAAAVRQTREVSLQRDGNVLRARWCAGCHDPVPLFAGLFDDPEYDDVHDPTSQAGITCTACHAITAIHSTRGNADYTIEEPLHYPFAFSENPLLRWINHQLIKGKPAFHKKTFLKPLHRTAEFCSVCHKVHIPQLVNDYKFLRGQNHYDTFLLSGVSGHGARSFYYPPEAKDRCASCHMPLVASADFGAQRFDGAEMPSVHSHLFLGANTAIAHLRGRPEVVEAHRQFLQGKVRVDIFGLREGQQVDGRLLGPLRPELPALRPGVHYVLEVVVRTLGVGHPLTQGTADSNEVWLDVSVRSGERVLGHSGALDARGRVDPASHFVNVFMLDRQGYRIARRNPQDIFVPLYDNQIPPGAASTVHYALRVPQGLAAPVTIEAKLQYRKFDLELMEFVARSAKPGQTPPLGAGDRPYCNELPIVTLAEDRVVLPVEGVAGEVPDQRSALAPWERWNDYGIGLLLKGRAQLRQAAEAFAEVEKLGRPDGPLNLARVYYAEGRLEEAAAALRRAAQHRDPAAPSWTLAWLSGLVSRQQGRLQDAERNFRSVLEVRTEEMVRRGFDFSRDYEVINQLGETLFDQAKPCRGPAQAQRRRHLLRQAVAQFEKTLSMDPENVSAHYNLSLLYAQLGETVKAKQHAGLYAKYKPDDNARDRAVAAARIRYPHADRAAERVAIYPLVSPSPSTAMETPSLVRTP